MSVQPRRARCLLLLVLAAAAGASAAAGAAAQSVLVPGDIGVVTTTGFSRLRALVPQSAPVNQLPASAFGLPAFENPAVGWESGTDAFLVSTGASLFRVTVQSAASATITDLSPAFGGPVSIRSLDLHPGTGALYLHDALGALVLGFDPPFAAGMTPDLVLPTLGGVRSMCLDSRDLPSSVVVGTGTQVSHQPLDGSPVLAISLTGATDVDDSPVSTATTYIVGKNEDEVFISTGSPSLVFDLNVVGFCSPIVLGPVSVAGDTHNGHAVVLAEEGANPGCFFGVQGPNHVVSFPPAQGPVLPELLTDPAGSGITGVQGDIALVQAPFAFPSPYGFGCPLPGGGDVPTLDCSSPPFDGNTFFELVIQHAAPGQPVFLLFGLQPAEQPLLSGCTALVALSVQPFLVGATAANGQLTVPAPLPAGIPPGLQVYLQAAQSEQGEIVLTNGLLLHFQP